MAPHDTVTVIPDPTHTQAVDLIWEVNPKAGSMREKPGVSSLRSNGPDGDAKDMGTTYALLTDIESVFRALQSERGLRPTTHQERRADGHLLISVIASQAIQVLRRRMRQRDRTASWTPIRHVLRGRSRVTTPFARPDGRSLHLRKTVMPDADPMAVDHAMPITPPRRTQRKTVV